MDFVGQHSLGVTLAVIALFVVALLWFAKAYNRLVRLRNRAEAMWAEIDVQLKRRHDLVPNLVRVVEGYATHERGTLDEVTRARNQAVAARLAADQAKAENVLTASLGRLFADAESYPNLEAEPAFKELQDQLEQVEQAIAMARGAYNTTVQAFNNAIETVPGNLVAWFASMSDLDYLGAEDDDRVVPSADLGIPPAAAVS
jgi:LemA protein